MLWTVLSNYHKLRACILCYEVETHIYKTDIFFRPLNNVLCIFFSYRYWFPHETHKYSIVTSTRLRIHVDNFTCTSRRPGESEKEKYLSIKLSLFRYKTSTWLSSRDIYTGATAGMPLRFVFVQIVVFSEFSFHFELRHFVAFTHSD